MEQIVSSAGSAALSAASPQSSPGAPLASERAPTVAVTTASAPGGEAAGRDEATTLRRSSYVLLLFATGIRLVGLPVTVPLVLVLLTRYVACESWRVTGGVVVGTCAALYLLFVRLLRTPVEGGVLLPF